VLEGQVATSGVKFLSKLWHGHGSSTIFDGIIPGKMVISYVNMFVYRFVSRISALFFFQTNDTSAGQKDVLCKQMSCLLSIDLHYLP